MSSPPRCVVVGCARATSGGSLCAWHVASPPLPSPRPDLPPEVDQPSGSHNVATIGNAVIIAEMAIEKEKHFARKTIFAADVKWFVGSMAAVALAVVGIKAWAQSEIDAGTAKAVASVGERVTRAENDIVQVKVVIASIERSAIRSEAMLEMDLRRRGIEPPPRVAVIPQDGGR